MERLANSITLLSGWRRAGLAFLCGAVTVLAQAPFHIFAICFLTFPVLVWMLDGALTRPSPSWLVRSRPAFVIGFAFGFGYFVAGLWWIGNALFVEAEEFLWAWPLAVIALPALLALFYGFAAVLARTLWSDGVGRIAALAFAFGVAEWLRSFVLTGFPWNAIGYAAMPVPALMQSASLVGIFGMNAIAVFAFCLPALVAQARPQAVIAAVLMAGLIGGHTGYGLWRLSEAGHQQASGPLIRVVQPAIDQSKKLDPASSAEIFETLLDLTIHKSGDGATPDIVVWPETSIPFILTEESAAVARLAQALQPHQVLLAGAVRASAAGSSDGGTTYFNSIFAIDGDGVIVAAADKKHLVPFGEYLPFAETFRRAGITAVAAADRGYSAAENRRTIDLPGGLSVLPSICYEAIFPGETAAAGEPPDVMVNVTNDAWYGNTPGPYQHAHQARIRAVENGFPLVRAANNGVSAIYDGYGRQLAALGYGPHGAIEAAVPEALAATPYQRHGRVIFLLLIAGLFAAALYGRVFGGKRLKMH
ncbi:apolipoprotein N-acyltransferase [Oricola sp.]|uniref:apolipoprotein N-acyltransferase n=1 Tax=Oricola sp. TaxID=1979950 RepID=UPI003BACB7D7